MVDEASLERMIFYATLNKESVVLEVGAGLGFLTRHLSPLCKRIIAVEIDSRLVEILTHQLRNFRNVELIAGDALKVQIPHFDKLVSVPPYSISSPLMFWLLEKKFDCAVLVFQREFAERLIAPLGSKKYGRLTVIAQHLAYIELLDIVPRKMFYPIPAVDSIILRLKSKKAKAKAKEVDEEAIAEMEAKIARAKKLGLPTGDMEKLLRQAKEGKALEVEPVEVEPMKKKKGPGKRKGRSSGRTGTRGKRR